MISIAVLLWAVGFTLKARMRVTSDSGNEHVYKMLALIGWVTFAGIALYVIGTTWP